ncbi:hypothetical protein [Lysinibacillus sphaericus]|uniref:Uncharacterized protein n=1 Tax=Lysinibacillus sphaericus OT4b.31 TaxID=1285586 RepID=R7Z8N9_LYSSH|nr:hypothetical protein [Lysinibacillus sphaericus]EON70316.1 hypothetical protein H131_22002 [Lysinibacillus sphaericus OT4b.31]
MVISLHTTGSPVSRAERNKINENWNRIITGLTNLQIQINILAGGEVDELLERLNQAVNDANIAVQQAIAANEAATQETINANNTALQTALQTVSNTLTLLDGAITSANTATASANDATNNTNQAIQNAQNATQDALNAVTTMQNYVNQLSPKSEYNNEVQYFTNNIVTLNGSSFITLKNTKGNAPPTPPLVVNAHWQLLAEKGGKGDRGDKGERGTDGKDGTGVNIIGELLSESDLPTTGSPGDAYMIHGDLYVWQDNSNTWKNVGPIQGPQGKSAYDLAVENGFEGTMEEWIESLKGIQGPQGPEGPQGPPADLTEVTARVAEVETVVDGLPKPNALSPATIDNTGQHWFKKSLTFNANLWNNDPAAKEYAYINIPIANFMGAVKMTITSGYNVGNSAGSAVVIWNIGKSGATSFIKQMEIISISPAFASCFYVSDVQFEATRMYFPIHKKAGTSNNLFVSMEVYAEVYSDQGQVKFNEINLSEFTKSGEPSTLPQPWTPQTSSFVTKTGNNVMAGALGMGGNLSITKGVPTFEMIVPGSATSSSASIQLNASSTVDYGLEFKKNNTPFQIVHDQTNVVFMGYDSKWFSIQDLKQSASDVKTNVAAAITEQGVTTSPTATGAQMAANIRAIPVGAKKSSGTTTVTSNRPGYAAGYIRIANLGFTPRTIVAKRNSFTSDKHRSCSVYYNSPIVFGEINLYVDDNGSKYQGNGGGNSTEFWLQVESPNGALYDWQAYGD